MKIFTLEQKTFALGKYLHLIEQKITLLEKTRYPPAITKTRITTNAIFIL